MTILASGGEVHDGQHAAARYYSVSRKAFPDQRHKLIAMHHADDAVIVEFDPMGTHKEPLGSVAPTGREFTCRMAAIFFSEGDKADKIACERVYFDSATIQRQLGIAPSAT